MRTNNFSSANANKSAVRNQSTFLVKPRYEGRAYKCSESGFDATTQESVRVIRLEDMRQGIEDHTTDEFYDLKGKQPVFFLMETLSPEGQFEWNRFILFSHVNIEVSRKLVNQHKHDWNVVAAFADPDDDRYFFLIDTKAGDHSDENFIRLRKQWAMELNKVMSHVTQHNQNFYVRAIMPEYYDIVDRDALFGKPQYVSVENDGRTCRTMSVGEVISMFFDRIFNH